MRIFNLLFIVLLSCSLSSCVVALNDLEEGSGLHPEVSFFSTLPTETKGFILTDNRLESMGVFAYSTETRTFEIGSAYTEEMFNQRMTRSKSGAGVWRYAPLQFWPENENYKMSFFAYAPYSSDENGLTLRQVAPGEIPAITYNVPEQVKHQPDLCISIPQVDLTKKTPDVNFKFKHVLSCISFFIEGAGAEIKGVAVTGIKTRGELSLGLESDGRVGAPYDYLIRWTLDDTISERDYSAGLQFDEGKDYLTTTDEVKNILEEDGFLMMLPQTLTSKAKIILTLADGSRKEFPLNMMTDRWQAGVRYQYKLKWRSSDK